MTPVRSLATVDRSAIRGEATFIAVAIAIAATGLVMAGAPSLTLTAGIAIAFQGMVIVTPDGPPARAALASVPLVAASVLVAGLASPWPAARILVCTLIAAAGGLATARGRRAGSIGMLCAVVAAIASGDPVEPGAALATAGLYAAASCIPLLLLLSPAVRRGSAPVSPHGPSLRDLLTQPSATRRHAARYATGLAIATTIAVADPVSRSFWVPMTVAWVLRPDAGVTTRIVLHRVVGTFAGVIAIAALTQWLGVSGLALALVGAAMGGLFVGFVFAHYATATAGITGLVVAMIVVGGGPLAQTLRERMVDTTAGALIAVLLVLLWRDRPGEPELPTAARDEDERGLALG